LVAKLLLVTLLLPVTKAAFDSSSSSTFREHLLLKLMTVFVVCPLLLYHCRHRPDPRFPFSASLYLLQLLLLFARTLWNALSQMPASFYFWGISNISSLLSSTAMWNSSQCSQELEVSGS